MMARFDGDCFELGLLHQVVDFEQAAIVASGDGLGVEHAVGGDGGALDHLRRQHRASGLVVDFDHLLEARHLGVDDVVGKNDGKGLVADKFFGGQHGMAQAQRFFLADVGNVNHVGDVLNDRQQVGFAALLEHHLQLVADVEVVFDGALAAAGDDDDLIAAGGHRFLDAVLNDGLVDQREHFLGLRLGGREEARAEACCRENRLTNFL